MMRKTSVRSSGGNWILRIMRVWNKKTQKGRQIDLEVFSYILRNGVNICSYRERVMQKRLTPNDAETPEDWMKLAHAAKRRAGAPRSAASPFSRFFLACDYNAPPTIMSFFTPKLGIDLGTTTVLVFVPGRGIVLNEPSVVAVSVSDNRILAVGNDAKEMVGRTPDAIRAYRPMKDAV